MKFRLAYGLLFSVTFRRFSDAYWLMVANNILTTQRIDPVADFGRVSTHVHSVIGGSNFSLNSSTASLRESECTSIPIPEDKSNYWYPQLYFHWSNGSFSSVAGNPVIYYLYDDKPQSTTAFPDEFRMISGEPTLRSLDPSSFAQQALSYLCLDFNGKSTRTNELPGGRCPSGIRSQTNFPSCWDGRNIDSPDHKAHVAFLSTGPDNGTCSDPAFPITLPRIFLEVYWYTQEFDSVRRQAAVPNQPFVFSNGDPIGYSFHADFMNGWQPGVLQRALDECNCNPFGDPSCCVAKGIFQFNQQKRCSISNTVEEQTLGLLPSLPGANPVQAHCYEEYFPATTPALLSPVFVSSFDGTNVDPPSPTTTIPIPTVLVPASSRNVTQLASGRCITMTNAGLAVHSGVLRSWALALTFVLAIWGFC